MLIDFFFTLKDAKIPVSIKEFLILLEALQKNVIGGSLDDFYYLSRITLVKDEAHFDKFDKAFSHYFHGIDALFEKNPEIPLDWLIKRMQKELTPEQIAQLTRNAKIEITFGEPIKIRDQAEMIKACMEVVIQLTRGHQIGTIRQRIETRREIGSLVERLTIFNGKTPYGYRKKKR